MDENNNMNVYNNPPVKESPFKKPAFYLAYFVTIISCCIAGWAMAGFESSGYWVLGVMIISIPYIIVGVIIWAFLRRKNHAVAMGILLGSVTPFTVIFVVTGGCGSLLY